MNNPGDDVYSRQNSREFMMVTEPIDGCQLKGDSNMESGEDSNDEIQRYMHGRGCSKRHTVGCTDDFPAAPVGQCMEPPLAHSPIPSTSGMSQSGSSGRTRRTGLLTVMERPPGKRICLLLFRSPFGMDSVIFCKQTLRRSLSLFAFLYFS